METEKFSRNSGCLVYVTTNNQIFGNNRLWTRSCHPLGIPKYNLGGVTSYPIVLFSFLFFFSWVVSLNSHAQIYVSGPDTLRITISKGLWSLPGSVTVASRARQMSTCSYTCSLPCR